MAAWRWPAWPRLAAVTALSILWSLHPADSWIETNRTLAYLAAFAGGIAAVRLVPRRWDAVLYGVLIALAIVCLYGLATKVAPGWLAEDEVYARLREPYGYWNAVGVTAAMGIPICLWLGTRDGSPRGQGAAYPVLGILIVTMLLSFSRGSILAAAVGVALWLALVPRRLATLAVLLPGGRRRGARDGLGVQPERAHGRSRGPRRARGLGHAVRTHPGRDGGGAVRHRPADRAPRTRRPAVGRTPAGPWGRWRSVPWRRCR